MTYLEQVRANSDVVITFTVMIPGEIGEVAWQLDGPSEELCRALDAGFRPAVDHNGWWVRNWSSHEEDFWTLNEAAQAFLNELEDGR